MLNYKFKCSLSAHSDEPSNDYECAEYIDDCFYKHFIETKVGISWNGLHATEIEILFVEFHLSNKLAAECEKRFIGRSNGY